MASFTTILDKIGDIFKDVFTKVIDVAQIAEPIVDLAFPGISAIYNMTVGYVTNAEMAAAAAGKQSGTGAQKLALVLASLQPYLTQEAASLGIAAPTIAQTTAYVNAIVASLNAFAVISAPASSTPLPTTTTVGASQVTVEKTS